jgi:enoyl-CoA hydratase/carnithine racemase
MHDFGSITVLVSDRVARATLRWPDAFGSIDAALLEDLDRFVSWIEDNNPCDVVVLTSVMKADGLEAQVPDIDQCHKWEKLLVRVDRLQSISIAVIDGPCRRSGMQLALACDHRIATSRSVFQVVELKEGYLPGMNIFRLAKYLGIGVARRMLVTGQPLSPSEARSLGLLDDVCAPEGQEQAVDQFLARLAPTHPVVAQLARRLLSESFSTAFENFIGHYLASQNRCLSMRATDAARRAAE